MEKLLWSIAFPGFGQLLNRELFKGVLLIGLEGIVNVQASLNMAIVYSFQGQIKQAIDIVDYQWLMFYPCLYFFAMWDAYKNAGGRRKPYSYLPFVSSAYIVTIGTTYSSKFQIFGVLLGPIWLPILSVIPGLLVGFILQMVVRKKDSDTYQIP